MSNSTGCPERCAGCFHLKRAYFPSDPGKVQAIPGHVCLYILHTGHRRGVSVQNCNKHTLMLGGITA